jgi:nucleotide-binding universal stress UspA family protein
MQAMQPFQNVLVYVDPFRKTQPALERAVEHAKKTGARLSIVADVEETLSIGQKLFAKDIEKIIASHLHETERGLEGLTHEARERGVAATCKTLVGRAWLELLEEIEREGHDLLIKDVETLAGARGHYDRHFDMRLLRKAPCPVWLVSEKAASLKKIAAAIDVDVHEQGKNAFSRKIVDLARHLAELENCALHVIHAWEIQGESIIRKRVSRDRFDEIREDAQNEARRLVDQVLSHFPREGLITQVHVEEGQADEVVAAHLQREHEDLLVLGMIARAGITGLVSGNTAERILKQIECSILAVKPDGFASPVKV